MKKIFLTLSIASLLIFSSCGNDDSTQDIINELFFDGTSLVGEEGIAVDRGQEENHYELSFAISDGNINYNASSGGFQFSTSSKFIFSFGARSLGSSQFSAGTFEFRSVIDAVPDANYFFSGVLVDIDNSNTHSVTDGTITISGSSPDYTLQFDVTFTDGKTLTGAFVGTFELE